ncbi:4-hydroxybenzoate polyprenyltransferase [Flavobacterium caeni]|uniref:4-hydroxybenzoate polyprenyltransferase n=2 Tax=Flavobacterium caeni TaxID=490189 RepID=A0A1G5GHU7_9FLAO|nr:4-hydroxybenzoate polyprenyltransferase [Flavobacterium caeni]
MKIVSLFSVVRGYNIPVIVMAQYLSAIFILSPKDMGAMQILLDANVFILVLASSLSIASGYIINNFYDSEKDLINRPQKSMLDRLVSQRTKLYVYFALNFLVVLISVFISWRVVLFFSIYIFLIWFYSHKLKKYPIVGNLTASFLAVFPFFGILIYFYKKEQYNPYEIETGIVFAHAAFLYLLLLVREITKDLENIKGDLANDYQTIPVVYGESTSKKVIAALCAATLFPVYLLTDVYDVGYMDLYFYGCLAALLVFVALIWKASTRTQFLQLHNLLKFLIVMGVFCIVLIDPSVLVNGKKYLAVNF